MAVPRKAVTGSHVAWVVTAALVIAPVAAWLVARARERGIDRRTRARLTRHR